MSPTSEMPATGPGSSLGIDPGSRLERDFFSRPARRVARDLLGRHLLRLESGQRLCGRIVETEAYCDAAAPDLACHASRGRPSPRTAVMFGPPGFAYVYFSYGMHWLFNVITGATGQPNGVLIRALAPEQGREHMAERRRGRDGRPRPEPEWCSGPARLTQALGIDGRHDGLDLCSAGSALWLEAGRPVGEAEVSVGPRIGLGRTPEPWRSAAWRFGLGANPHLSRPFPRHGDRILGEDDHAG